MSYFTHTCTHTHTHKYAHIRTHTHTQDTGARDVVLQRRVGCALFPRPRGQGERETHTETERGTETETETETEIDCVWERESVYVCLRERVCVWSDGGCVGVCGGNYVREWGRVCGVRESV
jgi:hypothetical protein